MIGTGSSPSSQTSRSLTPHGVRYVAGVLLLQAVVVMAMAPRMIRIVRPQGGTLTEYITFALYTLSLLAGGAAFTLVAGWFAGKVGGPRAFRLVLLGFPTLAAAALVADIATFTLLGLHPYGAVTWAGIGTTDIRHLPLWTAGAALGLLVALFLVHAVVWRIAGWTRDAREVAARRFAGRAALYGAIGMATFVGLDRPDAEGVVARGALPFYGLWLAPVRALPEVRPPAQMGADPSIPAVARRPDLLFLLAESLRWDMFTPDLMPELTRFADRHRCLIGRRHYAGGHLTQYGTFSLLYGLDAYAFLPYMQEARPAWSLAVLRRAGYRLDGFDATGVLGYAIPPLVPAQFDRYETLLGNDTLVIGKLRRAVEAPSVDPKFLFGFLYSTHAPYLYPPAFERDTVDTRPKGTGLVLGTMARYRNSVRYLDHLLGRLLPALDRPIAEGRMGVVITGDHGEEFNEHGLMGHAAVGFYDERIRVPLVACLPGFQGTIPPVTAHADIFPTILDWMGVASADGDPPAPAPVTGRSWARPDPTGVPVAGAGFPLRTPDFALVTGRHKFWLTLAGPALEPVRLVRAADSLDREVPMTPDVQADLDRALAAYHREHTRVLLAN